MDTLDDLEDGELVGVKVEDMLEIKECMELGLLMSNAFEDAEVTNATSDTVELRMSADSFNEIMLRISFPVIQSPTEH